MKHDMASIEEYKRVFGDLWTHERWVCWKLKDGVKRPHDPHSSSGKYASSKDSITWSDGPTAFREVHLGEYAYNGVGYVFSEGGPLVGIDLDDCRNPKTGDIEAWAREIVDRMGSYTEVSPSGTGLHVYVRSNKRLSDFTEKRDKLEVYSRLRYFTTTCDRRGLRIGADEIRESPDGLGWLIDAHLEERTVKKAENVSESAHRSGPLQPDDWLPDAIEHLDPDMAYSDWLAIGMACFEAYGGSDRGFEVWDSWSSGGEKYDESIMRKKWNSFSGGDGYTGATIWRAAKLNGWELDLETDIDEDALKSAIDEAREDQKKDKDESDKSEDVVNENAGDIQWHSFGALAQDTSEYQPYLVEPGLIGPGDTCMIFSPPKCLKSMAVMDQCAHWSIGKEWSMGLKPRRPLNIAFLNFELKRDSIRRRQELLGYRGFDDDDLRQMEQNFLITSRFNPAFESYEELGYNIFESLSRVASDVEFDMLVIDPVVNVFAGESENDNRAVMQFIAKMREIADALSPGCALYMVHHASKMSRDERQREPFNALRGGSAFRGAYDTGIALSWQSKDRDTLNMSFEVRNGPGIDDKEVKFEDGEFIAQDADESDKLRSDADMQKQRIINIIEDHAQRGEQLFTASSFSKTFAGHESLPDSERTIRQRISSLVANNFLGYFDGSKYGFASPHPRSKGHLCTDRMTVYVSVGDYGEVTPQSYKDHYDEAHGVDPEMVQADGTVVGIEHPSAPESLRDFSS